MTIRFPANVPYEMWPELYGVFSALDAGLTEEAQRRWNASTPTPDGTYCQRSAGAIQKGYEDFKPADLVQLPDWEVTQSGNKDFSPEPGKIYWFLSKKTGPASWTPSGGSGYCWISAPDKGGFPTDGNTSAAMGQSGTILVTAGQIVSMKWGNGGVTSGAHYAVQ